MFADLDLYLNLVGTAMPAMLKHGEGVTSSRSWTFSRLATSGLLASLSNDYPKAISLVLRPAMFSAHNPLAS